MIKIKLPFEKYVEFRDNDASQEPENTQSASGSSSEVEELLSSLKDILEIAKKAVEKKEQGPDEEEKPNDQQDANASANKAPSGPSLGGTELGNSVSKPTADTPSAMFGQQNA